MRLCKELPRINELYTQVELPGLDLSYMSSVVKPHEYFLYPGRFFGREDGKALVWIVFPQPIGICCQNVSSAKWGVGARGQGVQSAWEVGRELRCDACVSSGLPTPRPTGAGPADQAC